HVVHQCFDNRLGAKALAAQPGNGAMDDQHTVLGNAEALEDRSERGRFPAHEAASAVASFRALIFSIISRQRSTSRNGSPLISDSSSSHHLSRWRRSIVRSGKR